MEGEQVNIEDNSIEKKVNELEVVDVSQEELTNTVESTTSIFTPTLEHSNSAFNLLHDTVNSLEVMNELGRNIIKSSLCPLKKVEDVVMAIIIGNQFGFPFMTSINNIYSISGKPTLSIHLQRAILLKNKVIFNKIYDYEPIYQFAKLKDDGSFDTKEVPNDKGQLVKKPTATLVATLDKKPMNYAIVQEVDRVTKYKFTRLIRLDNGEYTKLEVYSEFKISDAVKAQLTDKENWIKYPARMLDARALGIGAKEVASDLLMGIHSLNELADNSNIKYTITDNLEEIVVD